MDYKDTLNLPKTNFPMKTNLPHKEPDILKFWDRLICINPLEIKQNLPKYILHDGPPYAMVISTLVIL